MGEVVMRGSNIMIGYYRAPAATAKAFRGGWFHSGDLGVMHRDHRIEIRERLKDIIISGGENVSSVEVEQAIAAHPQVAEIAVVGVHDDKWGEVVIAFIVPRKVAELDTDDLAIFLRARLANFRSLRRSESLNSYRRPLLARFGSSSCARCKSMTTRQSGTRRMRNPAVDLTSSFGRGGLSHAPACGGYRPRDESRSAIISEIRGRGGAKFAVSLKEMKEPELLHMILIVGLGPIGGNIGFRLTDLSYDVIGLDLAPEVSSKWTRISNRPSWTSYEEVPWDKVGSVLITVRTADQLESCAASLHSHMGNRQLTVFVATTLDVSTAQKTLPGLPTEWRVFESPVSGGPLGSREGSLSIFLAGPERTLNETKLLNDMSRHLFEFDVYGQPALVKLLNNALAAFNAISTANIIEIAHRLGVDTTRFLDAVAVSSGQSCMSDHFRDFDYLLLFKDVRLLLEDVPDLPNIVLNPTEPLAAMIEHARHVILPERHSTDNDR
jgi:3-hydroxyisobutyrate dehydrogenase-like beta-hydroxyacid dehydrogenase